ncbi:MAG TPA: malectin domain-containing carbohydrate-binding protein, partial [Candidatus Solibacter sp.]
MSMQAESSRSHAGTLDRSAEERAALQSVLQSRVFQARPRLVHLLEYICERHFEGEADGLKEYSIATEVFRRPDSFDQATDSIVRVEVFRLRKKLREFYEGEGADQSIEIVIASGHYRPEFFDRTPRATHSPLPLAATTATEDAAGHLDFHEAEDSQPAALHEDVHSEPRTPRRILARSAILSLAVILALAGVAAVLFWWPGRLRPHGSAAPAESLTTSAAVPPSGPEVRIRCGYSRPIFKDDEGNVWSGDRFFSGGFSVELPNQHIARTRNPELYLTARSGVFSYRIPLAPGTYELHLHFAETTYSPASTLGGGENSRVFDVRLNGQPLLSQFDIVSDAGANTADIRVFRDAAPDKDGYLHLDFNGSLGLPMINAIEIVPGTPHQLRPIRMVAQNTFFVDKSGSLWMPDAYFSSGRLGSDKVAVDGTPEPGLFEGERYGNFTYALPVDRGTYRMTLYFSEKYWGVAAAQNESAGKRVFDIFCNGYTLTRGLDIAREAGPARALVKVYRGLRPNAQGKLIVSFVPEVNYASVDALEIEQE